MDTDEDVATRSKRVLDDVLCEILNARSKFPNRFASPHEAYAILLEESDELWLAVQAAQKPRLFGSSREARDALDEVRAEAIQVAAMAALLVVDLDAGAFSREDANR